jgi:hypothetical protein
LSGVQLGDLNLGTTGITVSTSEDVLSAQVTDVAFVIADADRVPGASNKQVTVSFTIQTALVSNDAITINYPPNFLYAGGLVSVTPAPPFMPQTYPNWNYLNVQVAYGQSVAAGRVTITVSGVQLGPPSLDSATGITVSTNKDAQSAGVASGRLGGKVAGASWTMTVEQRYYNRRTGAAVVTVGFTLATAYSAPGPNQVTINFPPSFFQQSGTPTVTCTDATGGNVLAGITATINIQQYRNLYQLLLSSSSVAWDTAPKVCVFSDLTTGPVTPGGLVSVQSTQDAASNFVWSGPLLQ